MATKHIATQLIEDLKRSWQKTLALGVLLLVFGFVAVPPIMDAFGGPTARVHAANVTPSPTPQTTATAPDTKRDSTPNSVNYRWQDADKLFAADPLLVSADERFITDPFAIDYNEFPPPILFAQDDQQVLAEEEQKRIARAAKRKIVVPPKQATPQEKGFVLHSTVVGEFRRAAMLNGRLYSEGADITHNGETYQLAAVFDRRVVLTRAGEAFELRLNRTDYSGIEVQREQHGNFGLSPLPVTQRRAAQSTSSTRTTAGSTTPKSGTTNGATD